MSNLVPESREEVIAFLKSRYGDPKSGSMSPWERVEEAINLRKPDRTPFDFWAVPETIEKLKVYLGVEEEEDFLQLLGIDCRLVYPDYIGPELEKLDDGTFYSEWGSHRRKVANDFSVYEEYATFPLANATVEEVRNWEKWPKTTYWDWDGLVAKIDKLNQDVRYHMRYEVGGIFESSWGMYGLDKALIDLATNPEPICAVMDRFTDIYIENVKSLAKVAGDKIDMVYTYDDVAIQRGLLMSPKMWRKYILPRHQRLNKVIKEAGFKILYHSCGSVMKLIDPFIKEMGIDVLNPLQPRAIGMDMQWIKDTFGSRIGFHGAIDLQKTLPMGSQQDVYDEVVERCQILGKNGGFICTSAHYIQADVPMENIVAMYTAPREVD
ncbi:MAG: hypothetical protein JEZ06_09235 [Anaerolineaceae bacterium]|nr:hypothetical protein [Anaerolineaceae bacterium]